MEMNLYNVTYILGNMIGAYIVYRFFHIFYPDQKVENHWREYGWYVVYFFVLTATYFTIDIPIVMLLCNILCFVMLSFLYSKNVLKNVFVSLGIYLILMTTETIVAFLTGYFDKMIYLENDYTIVFGIIASKITAYVMLLLISNFQNLRSGTKIHNSHWVFILVVPIGTLYLLLQILQIKGDTKWQEIVSVFDVLVLNFGIFWLYDFLIKTVSDEYEKVLLKKEKQYFENQLITMEKSVFTWKRMKHDLKNHFIVLDGMLDGEDNDAAKKYLQDILKSGMESGKEISTGNIVIDSIMNYKILEAEQEKIAFVLDMQIPEKLKLPSHEVSTILGNAIDNAIEAVRKTEEKRICVVMKYTKGRLLLQIKNAFVGQIEYTKTDTFKTQKADYENHGFGIQNIKEAVERLDGVLNIDTCEHIFTLTILLPVKN